jgi:hypothetical protein
MIRESEHHISLSDEPFRTDARPLAKRAHHHKDLP